MTFRTIGSCFGISKKNEVLIMTLISVCFNIFDMSLLELGSNMEQIWSINLDDSMFPEITQHNIKSFLSAVVLIRSFTLHLYITLSIAMLWPAMNGDRPGICLPWLLVSGIKNLGTSLLSFAAGLFICATYGSYRPACLIFSLGQLWIILPSLYMWIVVLSFYRDLKMPKPIDTKLAEKMEEMEMLMAVRRRKVRSMTTEAVLRKQIENRRKYTGSSALGLEDFFKPVCWENLDKGSRSLDSLLEVMATEAELIDAEEDMAEEFEEGMSPTQKTMKLLGITESQINLARSTRMIPRANFPRMKLKHPKSMHLSEISRNPDKPGPSSCKANKNKLLTETSLYNAPTKLVRPTKSELKSPKEFLKLKSPAEFMNTVPETEIRTISLHSLQNNPFCISDLSHSETDSVGSNIIKKKLSEGRSKLPRRILRGSACVRIEQSNQDMSNTKPCLKKNWKDIDLIKKSENSLINPSSTKKKTSKVNFVVCSEDLYRNSVESLKTIYKKCELQNVKNEALNENFIDKSQKFIGFEKITEPKKCILDDSKGSTNISINKSESGSSNYTTKSLSESDYSSDMYELGKESDELYNINLDKVHKNLTESSKKPKKSISAQGYENKVVMNQIPILVPINNTETFINTKNGLGKQFSSNLFDEKQDFLLHNTDENNFNQKQISLNSSIFSSDSNSSSIRENKDTLLVEKKSSNKMEQDSDLKFNISAKLINSILNKIPTKQLNYIDTDADLVIKSASNKSLTESDINLAKVSLKHLVECTKEIEKQLFIPDLKDFKNTLTIENDSKGINNNFINHDLYQKLVTAISNSEYIKINPQYKFDEITAVTSFSKLQSMQFDQDQSIEKLRETVYPQKIERSIKEQNSSCIDNNVATSKQGQEALGMIPLINHKSEYSIKLKSDKDSLKIYSKISQQQVKRKPNITDDEGLFKKVSENTVKSKTSQNGSKTNSNAIVIRKDNLSQEINIAEYEKLIKQKSEHTTKSETDQSLLETNNNLIDIQENFSEDLSFSEYEGLFIKKSEISIKQKSTPSYTESNLTTTPPEILSQESNITTCDDLTKPNSEPILKILIENNNKLLRLIPETFEEIDTKEKKEEKNNVMLVQKVNVSEKGCQANTLSRRFFNTSSMEIDRVLRKKTGERRMKNIRTIPLTPPDDKFNEYNTNNSSNRSSPQKSNSPIKYSPSQSPAATIIYQMESNLENVKVTEKNCNEIRAEAKKKNYFKTLKDCSTTDAAVISTSDLGLSNSQDQNSCRKFYKKK